MAGNDEQSPSLVCVNPKRKLPAGVFTCDNSFKDLKIKELNCMIS